MQANRVTPRVTQTGMLQEWVIYAPDGARKSSCKTGAKASLFTQKENKTRFRPTAMTAHKAPLDNAAGEREQGVPPMTNGVNRSRRSNECAVAAFPCHLTPGNRSEIDYGDFLPFVSASGEGKQALF